MTQLAVLLAPFLSNTLLQVIRAWMAEYGDKPYRLVIVRVELAWKTEQPYRNWSDKQLGPEMLSALFVILLLEHHGAAHIQADLRDLVSRLYA